MIKSGKILTLAIDIGGSGIKLMVVNKFAKPHTNRYRKKTPSPATPKAIFNIILSMIETQPIFDRVSVGFPGVVKDGIVLTAPNLDPSWSGCDLAREVKNLTAKPTKVANDADIQGLGSIEVKGVELVLTLGTGIGSALFIDGHLVPNLELVHHPLTSKKTYEQLLGKRGLKVKGRTKWNATLELAIKQLSSTFNFDKLYLGGGNANLINFELPQNVQITPNITGLLGGVKLWA